MYRPHKAGVKYWARELVKLKHDLGLNGYFRAMHAIDHVTKAIVEDYEATVIKRKPKSRAKVGG